MFFAPEVEYLGHKISQQGIELTEKVRAYHECTQT